MTECTKCRLHNYRTNIVYGRGNIDSKIMIIGEAPGEMEDKSGNAFVGKAGKKLDELLSKIGLSDSDVFITNILQCRPPKNRDPLDDEIKACQKYLSEKIKKQNPYLIILVSKVACELFFGEKVTIKRGEIFKLSGQNFLYLYHPAYLLYNPSKEEIQLKWLENCKHFIQNIKDERSILNVL